MLLLTTVVTTLHLSMSCFHRFTFLLLYVVNLWCYSQANQVQNLKATLGQEVTEQRCHLPEPPPHGRAWPHPKRCSGGEAGSAECRMVPGTSVPAGWLFYYGCDQGFHLSSRARASFCRGGRWMPAVPACAPDPKGRLTVVSREGWGAQSVPPDSVFPAQQLPLTRVIIAHTVTETCNTRPDCTLVAQSIQQHQITLWQDIGYNFLVGGEGSVLEGQGWDHIGAHTYGYNTGSICVALIGNFVSTAASAAALEATKALIEHGVATGKLAPDYKLNAHCQLIQVASPGRTVFNEIKLWPNWDSVNALRCLQQ